MTTLNYDWRKSAAQGAMPDDAIEQAFFSQAGAAVQNKLAPLFKDPYRLGFEIVQKNDDNTRLVGIMAFRVNKSLLYAPSFFLNGEIKGTDLLYRHTEKRFVPATEDWAKHLLEKDEPAVGEGLSRSDRKKYPADMQLRRISMPPFSHNGVKQASNKKRFLWLAPGLEVHTEELYKQATADPCLATFLNEDWDQWIKDACEVKPLEPILGRFIREDGGMDAFEKIAYAIEHSVAFTERLLAHTEIEELEVPAVDKQASTPSDMVLFNKSLPKEFVEHADEFFKRGHFILDKRADEKTAIVYETSPDEKRLESVGDPGYYKILLFDGDEVVAFCARHTNEEVGDCCGNPSPVPCSSIFQDEQKPETVFVTDDGRTGRSRLILGTPVHEKDFLDKSMSTGETYRIYDGRHGCMSDPVKVTSKEEKDGITTYEVVSNWGSKRTIKHNPDYENVALGDGVLGDKAQFAKIKSTARNRYDGQQGDPGFDFDSTKAGDEDTLREWILSTGTVKKASLHFKNGSFALHTGHLTTSNWVDRLSLIVGLSRGLLIKSGAAEELADAAEAKGSTEFFIEFPKSAGTIRLLQHPEFQTQHDSDFGTEVEYPQGYSVPTLTETSDAPEHRIGDAWDPSMGKGPVSSSNEGGVPMDILLNSTPQQLAQMSQQDNIPHMFEHGAVGMLTNVYDSAAMIDKYLPDMEQGLDRGGRILYMFYWKPGDYQDLYGVDDMDNLENELLSNFKSWGAMVLNLIQKSKTKQQGSQQMLPH